MTRVKDRNTQTALSLSSNRGSDDNALVHVQLISNIANSRDKDSFAKLFDFYGPKIKSFALKLGAEKSIADDILQETMVAIWRHAHLYNKSKGSLSTWVYTIARNKRYDILRRSNRPEPDPLDPSFQGRQATPDEEVEKLREENMLRNAINNLPVEQAKIVRMSFYEGKTHQNLSEELNLPLGTVKSRLRLAIKKIREEVQEAVDA
ncbi:MAG: RNA polymerase subunit sigma [Rhodospirillaceae bacterium]|nr:RNA polymerase subunit sigma [Rhodospirillaceae bacterium]|tara:strand:+ start:1535 stop:2152 length:618 start_codon:yes stop_codon:yes gene_type:complete